MKGRFLRSQKTHASHSTDNHKKKLSKYWIGIAAGCVGAIGIFSAIMIPTLSKPSSKTYCRTGSIAVCQKELQK